VVKFHSTNSKQREKDYSTKMLIEKYQISKSSGKGPLPCFQTHMPIKCEHFCSTLYVSSVTNQINLVNMNIPVPNFLVPPDQYINQSFRVTLSSRVRFESFCFQFVSFQGAWSTSFCCHQAQHVFSKPGTKTKYMHSGWKKQFLRRRLPTFRSCCSIDNLS